MKICTLASSSSGNCTVVSHGDAHVLIDAGISLRRIRNGLFNMGLTPDDLSCVLVTHEHIDHIKGVEMLMKYHKTPVFASGGTGDGISNAMPDVGPYINRFTTGVEFDLGGIIVQSFETPHDVYESVGYTLEAGGKKLVYATDLGRLTDDVVEAACGSDIAIIEANHDRDMVRRGSYPEFLKKRVLSDFGHLSNIDCASLAVMSAASGTRYIQLSHLSRENNTPALARETVEFALLEHGIVVGKDVELDVAPAETAGRVYTI